MKERISFRIQKPANRLEFVILITWAAARISEQGPKVGFPESKRSVFGS